MRIPVTTGIPYFSDRECACKGSGIIKMDPAFANTLPKLRKEWGSALIASSICRTPEHNKAEKGHRNSLHLTDNPKWPTVGSMAADIYWRPWPTEEKLRFARLALSMGWSVGLHNGFCHVDRRRDLFVPELTQAVFLYGTWDGAFSVLDVGR